MKPTPLSKLKQELEEWKAKYLELEKYCVRESDRYASVLKAKEQDLSFANSAKDTAEMDKWEAVADRDTYAKEIERLNRDLIEARAAAVQAGNERSVLYEELDEQKRETARVLDNALGISEDRNRLKVELRKQNSCSKCGIGTSDLTLCHFCWDKKNPPISPPPPEATWCPADKWFLGIPVLIIGLCFYAIWHSHPNPVQVVDVGYIDHEEWENRYNECHDYALKLQDKDRSQRTDIANLKEANRLCNERQTRRDAIEEER